MKDKQSLRIAALEKRRMLTEEEYRSRCLGVRQHFEAWQEAHQEASTFHCFLPIVKNKEPDTWPIIDLLRSQGKKIVVSKSDLTTNLLTHYCLEDRSQLQVNKWGIPEPVQGKPAEVADLDVILIPLLTFDEAGHRIGYGKGYYDRFLEGCRPDVLKVGISIFPPSDSLFDADPHDIAMDYCITHQRVYQFEISPKRL
ncbi:MAG: 5-formyltetrahydrofolate cyclo-ligase [Bacteroidota bacterium]